jgi:Alw26I/Eco31I/Esp3I family type II restriction endonuclease
MGRNERNWHPNFIEYMDFISNHENYDGLPIKRKRDGELSWIATAKSKIGIARKEWALNKALDFNFPEAPGVYAKVMLEIHPTKKKVCQVCGGEMDLYYVYPNFHLINALKKAFNYDCQMTTHINEVIEDLIDSGVSELEIKELLIEKVSLNPKISKLVLSQVVEQCEIKCRNGFSTMLGPGAMSNFPDRFDGFHTYNRCCRPDEDLGRSPENMKTYNKDRRAYEYWSGGNIHAANKFMGSTFFDGIGISADHIGPISLGFLHDSHYLRPMPKGDNSSKRDRLLLRDIEELILLEKETGINAMSWYSRKIWEYIKSNYKNNPDKIETFRLGLKQNMSSFMYVLWTIVDTCENDGINFLIETQLEPKLKYFEYDYQFNKFGQIINRQPRNITDSTRKEFERFIRIAFESVNDYHEKDNRNILSQLDQRDEEFLSSLCESIFSGKNSRSNFIRLWILMRNIQEKLIKQF